MQDLLVGVMFTGWSGKGLRGAEGFCRAAGWVGLWVEVLYAYGAG